MSLFAKARGYRVIANDIALRAEIVSRALIENSTVMLSNKDQVRLAMPIDNPGYAETKLAPDVFPLVHARKVRVRVAEARGPVKLRGLEVHGRT